METWAWIGRTWPLYWVGPQVKSQQSCYYFSMVQKNLGETLSSSILGGVESLGQSLQTSFCSLKGLCKFLEGFSIFTHQLGYELGAQ